MSKPVILLTLFILAPGIVWAALRDNQLFTGNTFTASTLDAGIVSLGNDPITNLFGIASFAPSDTAQGSFKVVSFGQSDFEYTLNTVGDSLENCEMIEIELTRNGSTVFDGKLGDATHTAEVGEAGDVWEVLLHVQDDAQSEDDPLCEFSFQVMAWQPERTPTSGFVDKEVAGNTIQLELPEPETSEDEGDEGSSEPVPTPTPEPSESPTPTPSDSPEPTPPDEPEETETPPLPDGPVNPGGGV